MIYLLTAVGLTPGGSSTLHIYTQTIHRTKQLTQTIHWTTQLTNWEECEPWPFFESELYTLPFALQQRKKQGKTSVRVAEECQLAFSEECPIRNLALAIFSPPAPAHFRHPFVKHFKILTFIYTCYWSRARHLPGYSYSSATHRNTAYICTNRYCLMTINSARRQSTLTNKNKG